MPSIFAAALMPLADDIAYAVYAFDMAIFMMLATALRYDGADAMHYRH